HFGGDLLDAVLLEPLFGLTVHATEAGYDAEFRGRVGGKRSPGASLPAGGQFRNRRRSVVDDEPEPQLLISLAIPREHERIAVDRGGEAGGALIRREVAVDRRRRREDV